MQQRGFTLIETIMVVIIVAIMAVSITYRWPGPSMEVRASADQLATDIRMVQTVCMQQHNQTSCMLWRSATDGYIAQVTLKLSSAAQDIHDLTDVWMMQDGDNTPCVVQRDGVDPTIVTLTKTVRLPSMTIYGPLGPTTPAFTLAFDGMGVPIDPVTKVPITTDPRITVTKEDVAAVVQLFHLTGMVR
ncbi:MAG: type II secretion system protein [Magnetococcales bacterium]|nr:type II secretion system protein [Magnetococcales bacterium]